MSPSLFTTKRATLAAVAVAASVTMLATSTNATTASNESADRLRTGDGDRSAVQALSRDNGISRTEATQRLATERSKDVLADRLVDRVGARHTGGAYLDAASGKLVVTATDAATARQIRAAGATTERVAYSTARLSRVHEGLDRFAELSGAGKVQGWYVDVPTNTVVVSTLAKAHSPATKQFLAKARSFGQTVDVRRTAAVATTAALYGGQQVNMSSGFICSLGFNATTSTGASAFVTAGHCAEGFPTFSRNGTLLGSTRSYSFPGNDYAAVNINDPAFWAPQAAVDMYNGFARPVTGQSQAAVGSSLCKSGRTTGWTCGTVEAYNQTVNYGGGDIVSGLVRHSACVEQGDSGGSNLSGNLAQGVSSGGQLYQSGSSLVCGEKVGQPNVSFHQPIGEALSANGLTLLTQ